MAIVGPTALSLSFSSRLADVPRFYPYPTGWRFIAGPRRRVGESLIPLPCLPRGGYLRGANFGSGGWSPHALRVPGSSVPRRVRLGSRVVASLPVFSTSSLDGTIAVDHSPCCLNSLRSGEQAQQPYVRGSNPCQTTRSGSSAGRAMVAKNRHPTRVQAPSLRVDLGGPCSGAPGLLRSPSPREVTRFLRKIDAAKRQKEWFPGVLKRFFS